MRSDWHQYFMNIAFTVSARATCPRRSVGCVIVRDRCILATGYNGSLSGMRHCTDGGCMIIDAHCIQTMHAELNAIAQAAKQGVSLKDSTAYVTTRPCFNCFKGLVAAGITTIYYRETYESHANHFINYYLEKHPDFVLEQI